MNGTDGLCTTVERGNREKFVCEAQDVIFFKFCENESDVHSENDKTITFQPEYTHQVRQINTVVELVFKLLSTFWSPLVLKSNFCK